MSDSTVILSNDELLRVVVDMRRRRMTYRAICQALAKEYNLCKYPGNLHRWLKSQRKRAAKINAELAPFESLDKPKMGKPQRTIIKPSSENTDESESGPVFDWDSVSESVFSETKRKNH